MSSNQLSTSSIGGLSNFERNAGEGQRSTLPIASLFTSPTSGTFPPLHTTDYPVEHVDLDALWYRKYFLEKEHHTFLGYIDLTGPVAISIVLDSKSINTNGEAVCWYRYIMRKKNSPDLRGVIPSSPFFPLGEPPWDQLLSKISPEIIPQRFKKFLTTPPLSRDLLMLDEARIKKSCKIGVLYCAPFQRREEEWFANTESSPQYEQFLTILGTKIELVGFKGFSGGLNTTNGECGYYSIHDKGTWKNYEIMYHVSTLLPYRQGDKHQITRKKHIGNDIVCIVFQDHQQPFSADLIKSQFLHVYIIINTVTLDNGARKGYRMEVITKDGVPDFGPPLPNPPIFEDTQEFKRFLVAKAINGENAALKTQKLQEPYLRARGGIIQDLVNKTVPPSMNPLTPPSSPRKFSQEDLDTSLRNLFMEQIRVSGPPPDLQKVKTLLEQGANPNIRIPQPKPSRDRLHQQYQAQAQMSPPKKHSPTNSNVSVNSSSSNETETTLLGIPIHFPSVLSGQSLSSQKLPNVLFAAILLSDDPRYVKILISCGAETMPNDSHFPNAFVFAARYQRVETMKCLLENVPALSDPESVDAAILEPGDPSVTGSVSVTPKAAKFWSGFTDEMKNLKNKIRGK